MRYHNPFFLGDIIEVAMVIMLLGAVVYLAISIINRNGILTNILRREKALNIITQRYAKGEISESEYKQKVKIIRSKFKDLKEEENVVS